MTKERIEPFVVIGSGPCGAVAAAELVRCGVPVVMLEAGRRPPKGLIVRAAGHTVLRWRSSDLLLTDRHVAAGDPNTEWFSTLSPGGLSNYWTAAVPRFAPEDFEDGRRLDERFAWPVGYDEMVPYYEVAEDVLTISGPTTSLPMLPAGRVRYPVEMPDGWKEVAASSRSDRFTTLPVARGPKWLVALRGSEFNSYNVVVEPLKSSAGFELRLGATATRIVVGSDGVASAVEYVDGETGAVSTVQARGVVVAAGAVDSTRLLLASPSPTSAAGLGNDRGLLGAYLHDHPKEWWVAEFERPLPLVDHPVYVARRPYAGSEPLTGTSATIGLHTQLQRPGAWAHRDGKRFGVQIFGMMVPDESIGIELLEPRSTGRTGDGIRLDTRYRDRDLATLRDAQSDFEAICSDAGHPVKIHRVDWTPRPGASVHFAGTVRMHDDEEFGVLDRWNCVHGTPNVAVVDLSCFTTNPEKNPTLTAMALAIRASRHLAASLA